MKAAEPVHQHVQEAGMDAVILKHNIDQPFITHVEYRAPMSVQRIDSILRMGSRTKPRKKDKLLRSNRMP